MEFKDRPYNMVKKHMREDHDSPSLVRELIEQYGGEDQQNDDGIGIDEVLSGAAATSFAGESRLSLELLESNLLCSWSRNGMF